MVKQVLVSQDSLEVLAVVVEKIVGLLVVVEELVIHLLLVLLKDKMVEQVMVVLLVLVQEAVVEQEQLVKLVNLVVEVLEVLEWQHQSQVHPLQEQAVVVELVI